MSATLSHTRSLPQQLADTSVAITAAIRAGNTAELPNLITQRDELEGGCMTGRACTKNPFLPANWAPPLSLVSLREELFRKPSRAMTMEQSRQWHAAIQADHAARERAELRLASAPVFVRPAMARQPDGAA